MAASAARPPRGEQSSPGARGAGGRGTRAHRRWRRAPPPAPLRLAGEGPRSTARSGSTAPALARDLHRGPSQHGRTQAHWPAQAQPPATQPRVGHHGLAPQLVRQRHAPQGPEEAGEALRSQRRHRGRVERNRRRRPQRRSDHRRQESANYGHGLRGLNPQLPLVRLPNGQAPSGHGRGRGQEPRRLRPAQPAGGTDEESSSSPPPKAARRAADFIRPVLRGGAGREGG